ncbi:MAG: DNA-processing protein DprA [Planctomycetes bacterium]|nr:DNA-processing protein DprA [Planctomycetota bacterium]
MQTNLDLDALLLARLRLGRTRGVGPRTARLLEERCGGPIRLFELSESALRALDVPPRIARALVDPAAKRAAEAELADHRAAGHDLIPLGGPRFPEALAEIHDPPQVLSLRGELRPDTLRVAIVGARRGTPEGLEIAYDLALGLAAAGVVVVSASRGGSTPPRTKARWPQEAKPWPCSEAGWAGSTPSATSASRSGSSAKEQ